MWNAAAESYADNDEYLKVETGSRVSIWRPFVFSENGNNNISAADWAILLKFSLGIDFDVPKCDSHQNGNRK